MAKYSREFRAPPPMPGQHVYEGIMFRAIVRKDTLDALKTWQARDDDIFLVTYPKSGTHWIYEIVSLIVSGGDPSKIERTHMVTGIELDLSKLKIDNSHDPNVVAAKTPATYEIIDTWKSPRVILTHLHEKLMPPDVWKRKVKVIYLGRNWKDTCCSLAHFALPLLPPERRDFDSFVKNFVLNNKVAMGSWFDHVRGYDKRLKDDNFLFVKYEDLHKDLLGEVKKVAQFLDRPISDELAEKIAHLSTMDQMKKAYDKFEEEDPDNVQHTRALGQLKLLHKGKVGNWKDKITGDLNAMCDEIYEERMAGCSIKFDFEL